MRRTHFRGRENILKRQLIHVGAVQPESDPTGVAGFGQAAGVEESARRTAFAPLLVAAMLEWAESPGGTRIFDILDVF
jgi:hypothetical protein